MSKISPTTIMEMCNIYESNEQVAEILKCSVSLVEAYRPFTARSKFSVKKRERNRAEKTGPQSIIQKAKTEEERMALSSRALLIRQLETGQHCLNEFRFKEIVTSIGLSNRLPKSYL